MDKATLVDDETKHDKNQQHHIHAYQISNRKQRK